MYGVLHNINILREREWDDNLKTIHKCLSIKNIFFFFHKFFDRKDLIDMKAYNYMEIFRL